MQPESSDGFASVGTILPKEGAALLPGGSFRVCRQSQVHSAPHIDHLVFRVPDLAQTEAFYSILLGPPLDATQTSVMYRVGATRIFFTQIESGLESNAVTRYDKESTGLNHFAFGLTTLAELEQVRDRLDRAGIRHSGIGKERYGKRDYIWMDDPAGMRVEFYVRPPDA
jgi:glyoxylase I family protein